MKRILFLLITAYCLKSHAQCYNNIGFDSGNFSGWLGYRSAMGWSNDSPGFFPGHHTIMTGNAIDSCCGNSPVVAPGGGFFSARLGDTVGHARRNKLVYSFTVTPADTVIYIKWAVVFAGGACTAPTAFEIRVLDSAQADTNAGGDITFTSNPGNWIWWYGRSFNGSVWCGGQPSPCPNETGSLCTQPAYADAHIPWTTTKINLTSYIGHTITCFFMASDCAFGGPWEYTYAYIDMYCDSMALGTDTEMESENYSVDVFPNPANGTFQVTSNKYKISGIKVYNVLGESIYQSANPPIGKSPIDISKQPNGIYFVRVNTEKGIVSKKVMVVK